MIPTAQRERKRIKRTRKYRMMIVQTRPQEGSRHQITRAQHQLSRCRAQKNIFNTILKHSIIHVSKLLYIPDNRKNSKDVTVNRPNHQKGLEPHSHKSHLNNNQQELWLWNCSSVCDILCIKCFLSPLLLQILMIVSLAIYFGEGNNFGGLR